MSPFPSRPFPPLPIPFPFVTLEVGPLSPVRGSGERYKLPSGIWGGVPAEIEFGAFYTSDGNKFNDFPENQMIKFHAEFGNTRIVQNIELRFPVKQ